MVALHRWRCTTVCMQPEWCTLTTMRLVAHAGCKGGVCAAARPAVHALRAAAADGGRQGARLPKGRAVRGARHLLCVSAPGRFALWPCLLHCRPVHLHHMAGRPCPQWGWVVHILAHMSNWLLGPLCSMTVARNVTLATPLTVDLLQLGQLVHNAAAEEGELGSCLGPCSKCCLHCREDNPVAQEHFCFHTVLTKISADQDLCCAQHPRQGVCLEG